MTPATARTLHELLIEAAELSPRSIAVIDVDPHGEPLARSYAELLTRTEDFAAVLGKSGLGAGDRVVVDAVNGAATVAMLMACSMVGAAFIPLSPEVPDDRARQIVELAAPHGYASLDGIDRLGRLTDRTDLGVVCYDWDAEPVVLQRSAAPRQHADPAGDPLGYLIFTSGSTGVPKGVAMPQRATAAFFSATRGMLDPADRVASTAPLQFDFCLLDIGMCLANRATLVAMPRDRLRWPRQLVELLAATGGTRVHAVPSVWRSLLRRQPELLAGLPPLNTVLYTGEPFPPDELALLRQASGARVVNCYGPTECMACSFTDVTDFVGTSATGMPVDGAYPGARIGIVDEDGKPVDEPGRPGQVRFSGPSVFAGYWTPSGRLRSPEAVERPAGEPASLLTGDYGHYGPDGRLYFDGRRDRQVKVSGNRVELAEIEATLTRVAGVDEARVVADTEAGTVTLAAFVAGPAAVEADCLRECADRLPHYMRPTRLICLPRLPKTASGKVDQQRLIQEAAQL